MNPEFGSRLNDLVFEQNDEVLKGLIRHYMIDAIKRERSKHGGRLEVVTAD